MTDLQILLEQMQQQVSKWDNELLLLKEKSEQLAGKEKSICLEEIYKLELQRDRLEDKVLNLKYHGDKAHYPDDSWEDVEYDFSQSMAIFYH